MNFAYTLIVIMLFYDRNLAEGEECLSTGYSDVYLDTAMEFLTKAKADCSRVSKIAHPRDCYDVLQLGQKSSGIYEIWPLNRVLQGRSIKVYCDMDIDGGGWTVIQRRGNFQRPEDYFYKDWDSYKKGFGNLDEDFWLGNDNIFAISNQKEYSARFDLRDVVGEAKYAVYDYFWIDDEYHKYMLHIKDYKGDAGDSMYPKHDQQKFSTKDQKNDNWNQTTGCAVTFKGAWWYNSCHDSNLNGLYLKGKHESHANGVNWRSWKGHKESLAATEMKLKPKDARRMRKVPEGSSNIDTDSPLHLTF